VRYALMLGLERVLADPEPHTASGTPLRRHQIDALAGMLTELIAAVQRDDEALANGNGNGLATDELAEVEDDEEDEDDALVAEPDDEAGQDEDEDDDEDVPKDDAGAVRRYRFRHPTRLRQDDLGSGLRRSRAHPRRADPHAPAPARHPVHE